MKKTIISNNILLRMIRNAGTILLLVLLVGGVSALPVSVDTTIVNSTYLNVDIWMLILVIGLTCMFISHIPNWDKSAPIWACLSPFFTFAALWFSTSLQYTNTVVLSDNSIILEHYIYHLDWMAVGLLGIVFIFSCLNVAYVLSGNSIKKPGKEEIETRQNKYSESDE